MRVLVPSKAAARSRRKEVAAAGRPRIGTGPTRLIHRVSDVDVGPETSYARGVLTVSQADVARAFSHHALARVHASWASPGDSARIVKIIDAVEPRTKGRGGGGIFPGFVGPALPQGRGETHVLRGAAVMTAGFLPRLQEGILDMSGPGADLSPFAATHNLVVEFEPSPQAAWEVVDDALRRGLLRLAARLAEAAIGSTPGDVEEAAARRADRLPVVGAVTNLQTQGAFKDVFVYGRSFGDSLPTLIDPGDLDDGAVVSGQYGHPSLRNPTWMHQNHPVVEALRARHDRDLAFGGVVLAPEPVDVELKKLVSEAAARVCALAGWDGAVVTKEGGGNADADVALKMDALEDLGVAACGVFSEMAGLDGTGPSLVVAPERATGMVSAGNYDERVVLPEVERALGGETIDLLGLPATGAVSVPTAVVYCALSPLGGSRVTCGEAA